MALSITLAVIAVATLLNAVAIALTIWRTRRMGRQALKYFHGVTRALEAHEELLDILWTQTSGDRDDASPSARA